MSEDAKGRADQYMDLMARKSDLLRRLLTQQQLCELRGRSRIGIANIANKCYCSISMTERHLELIVNNEGDPVRDLAERNVEILVRLTKGQIKSGIAELQLQPRHLSEGADETEIASGVLTELKHWLAAEDVMDEMDRDRIVTYWVGKIGYGPHIFFTETLYRSPNKEGKRPILTATASLTIPDVYKKKLEKEFTYKPPTKLPVAAIQAETASKGWHPAGGKLNRFLGAVLGVPVSKDL